MYRQAGYRLHVLVNHAHGKRTAPAPFLLRRQSRREHKADRNSNESPANRGGHRPLMGTFHCRADAPGTESATL